MQARFFTLGFVLLVLGMVSLLHLTSLGQEKPPEQSAPESSAPLPPVPKGVEVLARGPVHEAFATPTTEPVPTKPVSKEPPKPLEEMPPDQKPEGNVAWIGGYWAWDDERSDFLWVSGIWRTPPPDKRWVAGYWKPDSGQWTWVPGFWTAVEKPDAASHQVTYLPKPPDPPQVAPPAEPPSADSFYVPGYWTYHDAGYVTVGGQAVWRDAGYVWTSGYYARVQPGYVWVPAHYRWTPAGYVFISGYWDLAVAHRGVLYAPVVVDPVVIGPTFVYTPAYVVADTVLIDFMFVRPCYCHYYFGDYYGPVYHTYGFEACVVYSRRHYDAIFVYERYEHRFEPRWEAARFEITLARDAGRAPLPPRTLVQQNTIIQQNITNVNVVNNTTINRTTVNNQLLMPASQLAAAKGVRTVPLDTSTRLQARQQAQAIQQVALQRNQAEIPLAPGKPIQPRVANLNVPSPQPAGAPPARSTGLASGVNPAQQGKTTPNTRLGQPLTPATAQPHGPNAGTPARPGLPPRPYPPFAPKSQPRPGPFKHDPPSKRPPGEQKG
jgi:hypothetical protein